jgi:hypothetical protein
MSKELHSNAKRIIVRTEDNEIWKEFETTDKCAEFFGITKSVIYNRCNKPNHTYRYLGYKLKFASERRDGVYTNPSLDDTKEVRLRANETEDETRRRLGLNPYGEWRNDEWMQAMIDRVDKMLYPDGYDSHMAWLSFRGKLRKDKGQRRESEEERLSREIDEEFEQYTR